MTSRVTTFSEQTAAKAKRAREQRIVDAVELWLASLGDLIEISNHDVWGEDEPDPEIPPWVRKVTLRLDNTLFAPVTSALDELKLTPYRAGFAMGIVRWGAKKMEPDRRMRALARKHRFSPWARRRMGSLFESFLLRGGFISKAELSRSEFIPPKFHRYADQLERGPIANLAEFHRGYTDGLQGIGRESPRDRSDDSTELLFILGMWWRHVVRFKTITELHAWLVLLLGPRAGDKKRVEKICQRIGLRLGKRGRPRKIQTPALPG